MGKLLTANETARKYDEVHRIGNARRYRTRVVDTRVATNVRDGNNWLFAQQRKRDRVMEACERAIEGLNRKR